jgi:glycosyltransferase involved in cell wall biosynthesis
MTSPGPLFSVVVPTIGGPGKLVPLLEGLELQTLPRERFEIIVVFDGASPSEDMARALARAEAKVVRLGERSGPPVARNAGAATATGEYLVSTDDDVVPEPDWLANAACHLAAEPDLDVIEGVTRKPGGRPVRIMAEEARQYILCNLIVRRSLFERVGGFHTGYYEPKTGLFFREDADLGWSLERAGARVRRAPDVCVVHPEENPGFLDPLRWSGRYVMDGLLAARFPKEFAAHIEVHRLGPLTVRRPIVRGCQVAALSSMLALACLAAGLRPVAQCLAAVAALGFAVVWAKWRFDPRRLPIVLMVPFVMVWALGRGRRRAARLMRAET